MTMTWTQTHERVYDPTFVVQVIVIELRCSQGVVLMPSKVRVLQPNLITREGCSYEYVHARDWRIWYCAWWYLRSSYENDELKKKFNVILANPPLSKLESKKVFEWPYGQNPWRNTSAALCWLCFSATHTKSLNDNDVQLSMASSGILFLPWFHTH
jgi:hypothetical protein